MPNFLFNCIWFHLYLCISTISSTQGPPSLSSAMSPSRSGSTGSPEYAPPPSPPLNTDLGAPLLPPRPPLFFPTASRVFLGGGDPGLQLPGPRPTFCRLVGPAKECRPRFAELRCRSRLYSRILRERKEAETMFRDPPLNPRERRTGVPRLVVAVSPQNSHPQKRKICLAFF